MGEIFQLVYFSEAADDLSYTDIKEILEVSRTHNAKAEITGLLIYKDGHFLQLLEGTEDKVRVTLERIRHDDRNYKVKVLIEGPTKQRLFPTWSMAFHDGDIASNPNPSVEHLFAAPKTMKPSDIMPLLRTFRDHTPEFR